jgi:quinol monooxygenase YgiN
MIHPIVGYSVKREKLDEIRKAIPEFVKTVKTLKMRCCCMRPFRGDGASFVHFMTFADDRANKVHEKFIHVRKFVDLLHPNCEDGLVFSQLTLISRTEDSNCRRSSSCLPRREASAVCYFFAL